MRIRDVTLMMQSSCLWADGWIMVGLHLNSFIFPVSDSCVPLSQKIPVSCDKNVSCPVGELFSNNNWRGGGGGVVVVGGEGGSFGVGGGGGD